MKIESLSYLISGVLFGLVAGISPGPLLALVISETLKNNRKEGVIIAGAPIITDIPIILLSLLILIKLSNFKLIMGIISIAGALYIGYLAYESISVKPTELNLKKIKMKSLRKGVITNFLNPHPYLFWISVGSPVVIKAYRTHILSAVFFVCGFYLLLIGSKIIIAIIVDKSRSFLESKIYIYIIRLLGFSLLLFALLFIKEGLHFFGVI